MGAPGPGKYVYALIESVHVAIRPDSEAPDANWKRQQPASLRSGVHPNTAERTSTIPSHVVRPKVESGVAVGVDESVVVHSVSV